jgi:hypothetical protein
VNHTMSLSRWYRAARRRPDLHLDPGRCRRVAGVLALALGPLGAAVACNQTPPGRPGETCRPVEFASAKVSSATGRYVLTVSGTLRSISDRARLVPVTYVRQPEYWSVTVQECGGPGAGMGALGPYTVSLDVTNTLGTRGVQVIGANHAQNIDLATWDRPGGANG